MIKRFATAAGLLALSTSFALAQTATQTDSNLKEWQVAKVAKVGLAQALTTAEAQGEKGRAIDADFEKADGKNPTHYSIKVVYPDGKLVEYGIDAETGALLGAHMVGAEVTELIQGYVIARQLESTEAELMHTVFAHPTLSEMMHESVLDAYGRALHY